MCHLLRPRRRFQKFSLLLDTLSPKFFLPVPQNFFTPQNIFPSQLHPGWNSPLDQIILTWYVTSHHRESWSNWCSNTTPLHTVSFFPFTLQVFVHTYLAKKVSAPPSGNLHCTFTWGYRMLAKSCKKYVIARRPKNITDCSRPLQTTRQIAST